MWWFGHRRAKEVKKKSQRKESGMGSSSPSDTGDELDDGHGMCSLTSQLTYLVDSVAIVVVFVQFYSSSSCVLS